MRRFIPLLAVTVFAVIATFSCSENTATEVLSPWAEVDPVPVRGISPRVDTLEGKKIGLFANFKRAAVPISKEVEKRLKERFPDSEPNLYHSTAPNVDESIEQNAEKFEAWARDMDAVVAVVGD